MESGPPIIDGSGPHGGADGGRVGPLLLRSWLLLLVSDRPSHGYQLVESLGELGIHLGNSGYVYRTLRSMEAAGILASFWRQSEGGPPHRVYQLTAHGYDALDQCAEGVTALDVQLHAYLTRYLRARGDGWRSEEADSLNGRELAFPRRASRVRRIRAGGDA